MITAIILQLLPPFTFQALKVGNENYKDRRGSERIVERFLNAFDPSASLKVAHLEFEDIPELHSSLWSGKSSDGRRLSLSLPSRILIEDHENNVLNSLDDSLPLGTEFEAFRIAVQLKKRFDVPISWQLVKDPPLCDFGSYRPNPNPKVFNFQFGLKPEGHAYSTPGKSFWVQIAARGMKVLSLGYTSDGWILTNKKRITKSQAIKNAIAKLKRDGEKDPEPYIDQVGLQNVYFDNQRLFLHEVYVVPLKFRHVLYVDSKTGECSNLITFK
ncbi:MAG: hypothetical protein WCI55_14665 [Armatimonadota bacterium]